jgi:uncharacterized protein YjbI with pentapeptide repeats
MTELDDTSSVSGYLSSGQFDDVYSRGLKSPSAGEFEVWSSPGAHRTPLFRYEMHRPADIFLTHEWTELQSGFADWRYRGILGYVSTINTDESKRLHRWFSEKLVRHAYTLSEIPPNVPGADWELETQLIYVPKRRKTSTPKFPCTFPNCNNQAASRAHHECLLHVTTSQLTDLLSQAVTSDPAGQDWIRLRGMVFDERALEALHITIQGLESDANRIALDLAGSHFEQAAQLHDISASLVDLSGSTFDADLFMSRGEIGRFALSGSRIRGNLTLQEIDIRDSVFADRLDIEGEIRLNDLKNSAARVYFDHSRCAAIRVHNSRFRTLSASLVQTSKRGLTMGEVEIDNLLALNLYVKKSISLRSCSIGELADFRESKASSHIHFEFNEFRGQVNLKNASCGIGFHLAESRYQAGLNVTGTAAQWLDMHGGTYEGRVEALDLSIDIGLDLRNAEFLQPLWISGQPKLAILDGAIFRRELTLHLNDTEVSAVQTRFDAASRLVGTSQKLRVIDLSDTDVSKVQLEDADLSHCLLHRSINLGLSRIGGGTIFLSIPRKPKGSTWYSLQAKRYVVWEEVTVRDGLGKPGWVEYAANQRRLASSIEMPPLSLPLSRSSTLAKPADERQLISVYRDLRRAVEAQNEEDLSNQFYYSEMTLRRRLSRGWQRIVYTLYWLLGGYGVRPSRPFSAMVFTVAIVSFLYSYFDLLMLKDPHDVPLGRYEAAIEHILRNATSIFGESEYTPRGLAGLFLDFGSKAILLILLALTVVAVRAIVKRGGK